jgi:hypothetical protein
MKSYLSTVLIVLAIVSILSGCSNNDSNVVSDDITGILSIQTIAAPAQSGGSGTVSVKLIAPTGGPGSGAVTISSTSATLISFAPSSQSVNSGGTATFYFTTATVTTDTVVPFTVSVGALTLTKSISLIASSATTVTPPVVTSPAVNSIAFVSASPTSITLKGAGGAGRTETSVVSFIVRDVAGQPLAGQTVDFTLDTNVGGLALIPVSATSDTSGTVKTIVNAGVVSTPVRVTATVRSTTIAVKSDQLTVSTGLPHQDGLSISADRNPEAWSVDGTEVPVTAMLSDHFGNPVPDGTSVYFTAFGGSIEPVGTTVSGKATVKWRSQNPRPVDGKARILVYAIGEESFTDLNGNGLADAGEFTDLPEPFLSKSGKTTRDATTDPFIDFNGDGIYNNGDGKFNGILQGNLYVGAPRSLYVFNNSYIIMSGSIAQISPSKLTVVRNTISARTLTISDENGNTLPGKTTITFTATAGSCLTDVSPSTITVSKMAEQTNYGIAITNTCTAAGSDYLTVTVKSPLGAETRELLLVSFN